MEADFMERPVQFLSRIVTIMLCLLCGCRSSDQQLTGDKRVNKAGADFSIVNGLMNLDGQPFTGMFFTCYPGTNDTAETSGYFEGREHGLWKRFYPDGRLEQQRKFAHGRKVGDYIAFWQSGKTKLHYRFANDEYQGLCSEWNADGRLIKAMTYAKGHEAGPQKMFYDNGKVRSNYTVINGRRYGLLGTKNCVSVSDSVFRN